MNPPDLGGLRGLAAFSPPLLDALGRCASALPVTAAAPLFRHGDRGQDLYAVRGGRVRIRRAVPAGECVLGRLGPGELFGEVSYLDGEPRSADAVPEAAGEVIAFDAGRLAAVAAADPQFDVALAWTLWRSLSAKLRGGIQHLVRFFPEAGGAVPRRRPAGAGAAVERMAHSAKRLLFETQELSSMESNFLASLAREARYAAGEVIFREGEAGEEMYLVADGRVVISKFIPGAGEEALAVLARGDIFGEMALIDGAPRAADAKAHEEGAVVLAISRDVLGGLLTASRFSSVRLLKRLCAQAARRLRQVDEKITGWYILAGEAD